MLKDIAHLGHPLGTILVLFSAAYLAPVGVALFSGDGTLWPFLLSMTLNFLIGLLLRLLARPYRRDLKTRDGYLLLTLTWIAVAASATVPLVLVIPGLSITDGFFEAVSGITTTGAEVITGLDRLPDSINLWRCELSWIGGLGAIGLAMAALPLLGVGGMQLYRVEGTGPVKDATLATRLTQTARSLWLVYAALTVVCALALWAVGMPLFDAICHALSTLSLGAFSTHDASIGYFRSASIEFVLDVFMLLAAMNVATHFVALRTRKARHVLRDVEARTLLLFIGASIVVVAGYLRITAVYPSIGEAVRYAAFNLISIATGCGLYSTNYDAWPLAITLWMLLLSCVLASAGSTGGGIKMFRTLILFRQSGRELRAQVHPNSVSVVKVGGQVVNDRVVSSVLGFIHLYTLSVIGLTFLLLISGLDFLSAFSAIIATLNNVGPGLRTVGPAANYSGLSDFQTWVCTLSMLLGRLEIFMLIVPLTPAFWRE